jgi:hypothetical protein
MVSATRKRVLALSVTAMVAVAVAVVASGRGCASGDGTPAGAARAFVEAARAGDKHAAWDLLGPRTRARLTAAAEGATDRQGGPRRYRALDMLDVSANETHYAPSDIILRERAGERAVVDILGPSGKRDALTIVLVGGRWRVELGE